MSPTSVASAAMVAVPLMGLFSVVLARASEGRWAERLGHYAFWICLMAVGAATVVGVLEGIWQWPLCGFTLGVMVVGALYEPRDPTPDHF